MRNKGEHYTREEKSRALRLGPCGMGRIGVGDEGLVGGKVPRARSTNTLRGWPRCEIAIWIAGTYHRPAKPRGRHVTCPYRRPNMFRRRGRIRSSCPIWTFMT